MAPCSKLERAIKDDKIVMDALNAQLASAAAEKDRLQRTVSMEESLLSQLQVWWRCGDRNCTLICIGMMMLCACAVAGSARWCQG